MCCNNAKEKARHAPNLALVGKEGLEPSPRKET